MTVFKRAILVLVAIVVYAHSSVTGAVDVRGRVDTRGYRGFFPMPNAEVVILFQGNFVYGTLTDGYGFYYFRNLMPGSYEILINRQLDRKSVV